MIMLANYVSYVKSTTILGRYQSYQQVWDKFLTTCNNLDGVLYLALIQQCCYSLVLSTLWQTDACHNLLTAFPSSLKLVPDLFQQLLTRSVKASSPQLVNRLVTVCLQVCYNLCVLKHWNIADSANNLPPFHNHHLRSRKLSLCNILASLFIIVFHQFFNVLSAYL